MARLTNALRLASSSGAALDRNESVCHSGRALALPEALAGALHARGRCGGHPLWPLAHHRLPSLLGV